MRFKFKLIWAIMVFIGFLSLTECHGQDKADFNESHTGVPFTMKYIRGGNFQMGSNDSDANDEDRPVHTVHLGEFYMGKYEVTFSEYDKFCEATGRSKPSDEGWGRDDRPVINVNWYDAVAYCEWLTKTAGKTYRLPTEAEWEYAARGGNSYRYAGSDDIDNVGWYSDGYLIYNYKTHPVGKKSPNGYGLYDMSGNVSEWCSDWYTSYGSEAVSNPTGAVTGMFRVFRGGAWNGRYLRTCRVSRRDNTVPTYQGINMGFRVVCTF